MGGADAGHAGFSVVVVKSIFIILIVQILLQVLNLPLQIPDLYLLLKDDIVFFLHGLSF